MAHLDRYIREHNDDPKPFIWTRQPTPSSTKPVASLYLPSESVHQGADYLGTRRPPSSEYAPSVLYSRQNGANGAYLLMIMQIVSRIVFGIAAAILIVLALTIVVFGLAELIVTIRESWRDATDAALTAIGYVVIAIAVFDVSRYFLEEEVLQTRDARGFGDDGRGLGRFLTTIVIAVFIEGLVIVFQVSKRDITEILYPTALIITAVIILFGLVIYRFGLIKMRRNPNEQ